MNWISGPSGVWEGRREWRSALREGVAGFLVGVWVMRCRGPGRPLANSRGRDREGNVYVVRLLRREVARWEERDAVQCECLNTGRIFRGCAVGTGIERPNKRSARGSRTADFLRVSVSLSRKPRGHGKMYVECGCAS